MLASERVQVDLEQFYEGQWGILKSSVSDGWWISCWKPYNAPLSFFSRRWTSVLCLPFSQRRKPFHENLFNALSVCAANLWYFFHISCWPFRNNTRLQQRSLIWPSNLGILPLKCTVDCKWSGTSFTFLLVILLHIISGLANYARSNTRLIVLKNICVCRFKHIAFITLINILVFFLNHHTLIGGNNMCIHVCMSKAVSSLEWCRITTTEILVPESDAGS